MVTGFSTHLFAQSERGEVLGEIVAGATPLMVSGTVEGENGLFLKHFETGSDGRFNITHLLFGNYALKIDATGFTPVVLPFQVRSTLPLRMTVRLDVAPVQESITVSSTANMLDGIQASSAVAIGQDQIAAKLPSQPGRGFLDVIADQPGWIFEANGVLHPRGSEYQTQLVINGVPRTENLSPAFAMPIPANQVDSAQVRTAGIPAEYGRSLGGVIDITTAPGAARGWHGNLAISGGSFATATGDVDVSYGTARQQLAVFAQGYRTDRYLDPPVLENFGNHANAQNSRVDEEITLSQSDTLHLDFSQASLRASVPNEAVQEQAGQRQARDSSQYGGSASWQHTVSPDLLLTAAGSALDTDASLQSNTQSTPIIVNQQRGFRQGWARFDVAGHHGNHNWKVGADSILRHVQERLNYTITDPAYFDPGTQQQLNFQAQHWDSEPAAFLEDNVYFGNWNVAAGLRYDNYSFVVHDDAWSPRVAVSRFFPVAHLTLHASYDRVFQFPAVENLLLASSSALDSVSSFVKRLPVEPSRAHYFEVGFSNTVADKLTITANIFLRDVQNYADDDTLLNTGVSFPITTRSARIHGEEITLSVPDSHHLTAQLSYSNQNGTAAGPITGGLLLGDEGVGELADTSRFPISQDQRNTLRAQVRWTPLPRLWAGAHAQYNSGLPVELDSDTDQDQLRKAYGDQIVDAVNFDRGRVRPSSSIDLSGGIHLLRRGDRDMQMEFHVDNLGNRVNVINFASLFSGTAVGVPRSYQARLSFAF
ncbi:TonB-dependent receptor [Edaphobacter paludis]|uniref:TonB-dependent receptor n=1 Tax=Edaphobacter paludis TaxID=3035702 RepID=A0AAU7DBQ9_9BACT